jgi:hypothetical protein
MKLGDTWYCEECGSKIASGNRCTACLLREQEAQRTAIFAEGEQMAKELNPYFAAGVLMAMYERTPFEHEQQALAFAVHVLTHFKSPKKNQPSQFGDSTGLVHSEHVD